MGTYRAGILGGLLSFSLWNFPSFVILTLAGLGVKELLGDDDPDWLSGAGPAAIALVFIAAYKVSSYGRGLEGGREGGEGRGDGGSGLCAVLQ